MAAAAQHQRDARHILPVRGSSSVLPSRSATPSNMQSQSNLTLFHQAGQRPLASKLKHMFENQKYAIFSVTVVLHEIGNVPQLQGNFAVGWKFKGKKPRGKDSLEMHTNNRVGPSPKRSLPSLPSGDPSSSTLSVQTSDTGSSIPYPPTPRSNLNPANGRRMLNKSLSLPPAHEQRLQKKGSDPASLRQLLSHKDSGQALVELPVTMDDPEEYFNDSEESSSSSKTESRNTSTQTSIESSQSYRPPQVNVHRPSITSPSTPTLQNQNPQHNHLTVPFSRSTQMTPPSAIQLPVSMRMGTTTSVSTLLSSINPKDSNDPSAKAKRPASVATAHTSSSSNSGSSLVPYLDPPSRPGIPHRVRSISGPGASTDRDADLISSRRKGETPVRPLKQHACQWGFELHHMLKIPLEKPQERSRPQRESKLILGDGPLSDSGIELVIYQYPVIPRRNSPHNISPSGSSITQLTNTSSGSGLHNAQRKNSNKGPIMFGKVDVDLAPFAGKGRMTRRFLLKGSRTNATLKISVEMQWVTGDSNWVAPPLNEGHHVTGVGDLMIGDYETIRPDFLLGYNRSSSSSGSSDALDRVRTNFTSNSGYSSYCSPNHSANSLGLTRTDTHLTSYEEHTHDRASSPGRNGSPSRRRHLSLDGRAAGSRKSSPNRGNVSPNFSRINLPRLSAQPPLLHSLHEIQNKPQHHHHTHHLAPHHKPKHSVIHDLPPETIIEAIFNPRPANQDGPFTYAVENIYGAQKEADVVNGLVRDANNQEDTGKEEREVEEEVETKAFEKKAKYGRLGWDRMKKGKKKQERWKDKGHMKGERNTPA
ncbi:hypothetical protein L204_105248 [Cryptococcus depauperatus]|nr:hypothetical protein L204_03899 [Cryptococcus depauperatus CBS 7855]